MVTLPALKSLTLTSAEILRVPTTKRYMRGHSARLSNYALPVVNESDLRDSLEINISDEDSASTSDNKLVITNVDEADDEDIPDFVSFAPNLTCLYLLKVSLS